MPKAVVLGATLQCTCGSAPAKLLVNSQTQFLIDNLPAATVLDFKPGVNIPPLGVCSILTAAASGVATPCAMAPVGPWQPGSTAQVKFGDLPALLATDKLQCGIAGVISIVDPGQQKTSDA